MISMLKKLLKIPGNPPQDPSERPTAIDLWGEFPKNSPFALMQQALQIEMLNTLGSHPAINWENNAPPKSGTVDYGGLCGYYAFSRLDKWCTDYTLLLVPSFDERKRVRRIATICLFLEYGSLQMCAFLPDSQELELFISNFRVSVIRGFLMFDQSDERAGRVHGILNDMTELRRTLSGDTRQSTIDFLEQIGKSFLASIPSINGASAETTASVNDYMAQLFKGFQEGLVKIGYREY
jgi:hypothetical protein